MNLRLSFGAGAALLALVSCSNKRDLGNLPDGGGAGAAGHGSGIAGKGGQGGGAAGAGGAGGGGLSGSGGSSAGGGVGGAGGGSGGAAGAAGGGGSGAGSGGSAGQGGGAGAGGATTMPTAIALNDINAFTAPSGVFTKVQYTSAIYDDRNEFDTATHRFTATHAGDYKICASLTPTSSVSLALELDFYVNGTRERGFVSGGGPEQGCRIVRLAAGSYLEVWVLQSSGAAVTFDEGGPWQWMTAAEVSSTVALGDASAFSAATGTYTKVPYSSKLYDDHSEYDVPNSRFTAGNSGDYQICASLSAAPDTTHGFELYLYVNGARENGFAGGSGASGTPEGCRTVRLAAGSYVEVWVYQASGAAMAFSSSPFLNWLTVAPMPSTVSMDDASAFTGAAASFIKVSYGTPLYDDQAQFDTSMSRFTAAQSGDYEFCASLLGSSAFVLETWANGVRGNPIAGGPWGDGYEHGCRVVRLTAGNYVEIMSYFAFGSLVSYSSSTSWDWLVVSKLR